MDGRKEIRGIEGRREGTKEGEIEREDKTKERREKEQGDEQEGSRMRKEEKGMRNENRE